MRVMRTSLDFVVSAADNFSINFVNSFASEASMGHSLSCHQLLLATSTQNAQKGQGRGYLGAVDDFFVVQRFAVDALQVC